MSWGERRQVFGFVDAVSEPRSPLRLDLALDAVDAPAFEAGTAQGRDYKHLCMVRVMSTATRLAQLFDVGGFVEGQWLRLDLEPKPGMPVAWVMPADGDYGGPVVRTNVVGLSRLAVERPSVDPRMSGAALAAWCAGASSHASLQVTSPLPATAPGVAGISGGRIHVRVVDVGHANCAALHVARDPGARILGYYDVGRPVFFHSGSAPQGLGPKEGARVPTRGFVLLSHWDFDHYSLAVSRHTKALKALDWYAPVQAVGPNASRLQADLGARLTFLRAPQQGLGLGMRLYRGTAPVGDRNGSGYALRLDQPSDAVLMPGDVAYDHIDPAAKAGLTSLAVTHHGGRGAGAPPTGSGRAVVSYGIPNRYGHPDPGQLLVHNAAGWTLAHTASWGGAPRSDEWLTAP